MAFETISALRSKPALIQYPAACVAGLPANRGVCLIKVLATLVKAEGMMIGAGKVDDAVIRVPASSIEERTSELHR